MAPRKKTYQIVSAWSYIRPTDLVLTGFNCPKSEQRWMLYSEVIDFIKKRCQDPIDPLELRTKVLPKGYSGSWVVGQVRRPIKS